MLLIGLHQIRTLERSFKTLMQNDTLVHVLDCVQEAQRAEIKDINFHQ